MIDSVPSEVYVEFLKAQGVCSSLLDKYLSVQELPDLYANQVVT